ncbi:MAG: serine/threonine-protein kinase [Myxococcota bacterium]
MSNPDRFARVFEIFNAVADLPLASQAEAVAQMSGGDIGVRDEVLDMLALDAADTEPPAPTSIALPHLTDALSTDPFPEMFGPYRVVRRLGAGGMGVVFEAEQDVPRRRVALKVVHPWLRSTRSEALLRHEVQAMADVYHPGIPQVHQAFVHEETTVVVMELIRGTDLKTAWTAAETRPARLSLLLRIAEAVGAAHAAGVIHRDLKPSNIKVLEDGQPKVLDFGIATRNDEGGVTGAGSLSYASPEQMTGAPVDGRADVFALGALTAELVTGTRPRRVSDGSVRIAWEGFFDRELEAIVRRSVALRPDDRYATVNALADDLRAALERRPVAALGWAPDRWIQGWFFRNRLPLSAATFSVLLVGLGLWGWGAARDASREANAFAALEALKQQVDQSPAAKIQAMQALMEDPNFVDTAAISEGWMWAAEAQRRGPRRMALAQAWSSAQSSPASARAATALIEQLAQDEQWDAVRMLSPETTGSLPYVDLWLALEDGDLDAARAAMSASQRRLLPLLSQVEIEGEMERVSGLRTGNVIYAGERYLMAIDGVRRLGADGQTIEILPDPPVGFARSMDAWLSIRGGGDAALRRLPPSPMRRFADLDRDGILERYELGGPSAAPLKVSRTAAGTSKSPLSWLRAQGSRGQALDFVDLDQDGAGEVALLVTGWPFGGLLRVVGLPDSPTIDGMIQARRPRMTPIRGPDGPAIALLGHAPGVPHRAGFDREPDPYYLSVVSWAGGVQAAPPTEVPTQTMPVAADLNGDGVDEIVLQKTENTVILIHSAGGGWEPVPLPGAELLAAGDLDADGDDELWLVREGRSVVIGRGGDRLPARRLSVRADMAEAPGDASRQQAQRWERAETLASMGFTEEAVSIFRSLARFAGPIQRASYRRALYWSSLGLERDQVSANASLEHLRGALASELAMLSELDDNDLRVVDAILVDEHQPRPGDRRPSRVPLLGPRGLVQSAAVNPLAIRVQPTAPHLRALLAGQEGATALSIPLEPIESVIAAHLQVDVASQDLGRGYGIRLRVGEVRLEMAIARVGGGTADNHALSFACGQSTRQGQQLPLLYRTALLPFSMGTQRLTLSLDRQRETLRCAMGDASVLVHTGALPLDGTIRLELLPVGGENGFGQVSLDVDAMDVSGAMPKDGAPNLMYQAIHGDIAAAEALRAARDPRMRVAAHHLLREITPVNVYSLARIDRLRLLRADPATWIRVLRESLGDTTFAAHFVEAYWQPIDRPTEAFRTLMDGPLLEGLAPDTVAGWTINFARAQAHLDRGRLLKANAILDSLDDTDLTDAPVGRLWMLRAREALRRGDTDAARRALSQAVDRSPTPLVILQQIWDDPRLAALSDHPPPPGITPRQ